MHSVAAQALCSSSHAFCTVTLPHTNQTRHITLTPVHNLVTNTSHQTLPAFKFKNQSNNDWARILLDPQTNKLAGLMHIDNQLFHLDTNQQPKRRRAKDSSKHKTLNEIPLRVYPFTNFPQSAAWQTVDSILQGSKAAFERGRHLLSSNSNFGRLTGCPADTHLLKIGIVMDPGFTFRAGGREGALRELGLIINNVNGLFEDQLGVRLKVVHAIVNDGSLSYAQGGPRLGVGERPRRAEQGTPFYTDGISILQSGPSAVLGSFSQWAAFHAPQGAQVWHLLTDAFPAPGVTGLAWTGAACTGYSSIRYQSTGIEATSGYFPRTIDGYQVRQLSSVVPLSMNTCTIDSRACAGPTGLTSRSYSTWLTFAHELGHTLGGEHTFGLGGRMSYTDDIYFVPNLPDGGTDICVNLQRNMISNPSCMEVEKSMCGNGEVDTGEECDDGNIFSGDGCDENCIIECGYVCTQSATGISTCRTHCGDGILQREFGEECDDDTECCAECRFAEGALCSSIGSECCVGCLPSFPNTSCASGKGFCHLGECETTFPLSIGSFYVGGTLAQIDTSVCPVTDCTLPLNLGLDSCWEHPDNLELHFLPNGYRCVRADGTGVGQCFGGTCRASSKSTCGDGIVSGTEECDDSSPCCVDCQLLGTCSPPNECCSSTCEIEETPRLCANNRGYCNAGHCQETEDVCTAYSNLKLDLNTCPISPSLPCVVPCAINHASAENLTDVGESPATCFSASIISDTTPCRLPGGDLGVCVRGDCVIDRRADCSSSPPPAITRAPSTFRFPPSPPYSSSDTPIFGKYSPPPAPSVKVVQQGPVVDSQSTWAYMVTSWLERYVAYGFPFGHPYSYESPRWALIIGGVGFVAGLCVVQALLRLLGRVGLRKMRMVGGPQYEAAPLGSPNPTPVGLSTSSASLTLQVPSIADPGSAYVRGYETRPLTPSAHSSSNIVWHDEQTNLVTTPSVNPFIDAPARSSQLSALSSRPNSGALNRARAHARQRASNVVQNASGTDAQSGANTQNTNTNDSVQGPQGSHASNLGEVETRQNLATLVSMGFLEEQAAAALAACGGNVTEAVIHLTSG